MAAARRAVEAAAEAEERELQQLKEQLSALKRVQQRKTWAADDDDDDDEEEEEVVVVDEDEVHDMEEEHGHREDGQSVAMVDVESESHYRALAEADRRREAGEEPTARAEPAQVAQPQEEEEEAGPTEGQEDGDEAERAARMAAKRGALQVIPTPLHVLGRISPIFSPFFPVFCAFSPSRRGGSNEPQAGRQGQRPRQNAGERWEKHGQNATRTAMAASGWRECARSHRR